ncbi:BglG family transcription antiterminator [Holdemania massiliensis]|uniref:BglG family transcription antiterminator n=1 Tax=Holdemania massiliensis TaxID=1468449 RepID=UPI0002F81579|nr:PTS sugar transporter subunit IIA [Holdemania massiliensis]
MKISTNKLMDYLKENSPCTSNQLAKIFNVSSRTIKNYIKSINTEHPDSVLSSRNGYSINEKVIISDKQDELVPQTSNERVSYILNELLNLESNSFLSLYDICDMLYISYSTLKTELSKVKIKINDCGLELETKKDAIRLIGNETNKRKLINNMMVEESSANFVDYYTIQTKFPDIDIFFIRDVFIESLNNSGYFINDISLTDLVLHTAIAIDRIMNNYSEVLIKQNNPRISAHVYNIAKKAGKQFSDYFNIEYTDVEIYESALLIMSRSTPVNYSQLTDTNVSKYIKEKYLSLSQEILEELDNSYGLRIQDEKALHCFALHLQSLFIRSSNNRLNKNPLTVTIKTTCPFFFDAAVHISSLIKKKTGVAITDDEIAYIAIHIGFMMDKNKKAENKIATVLYCPRYYDAIGKLIESLNKQYQEEIALIQVATAEDQIGSFSDVDLIISILPIKRPINICHVQISMFLTNVDKSKLQQALETIQVQKQKLAFEKTIRALCPPSLFQIKESFPSPYKCISFMCSELINKGFGNANILGEILEREALSSTAFGSFAIPHSPMMQAVQTTISIVITRKAITWSKHPVKLVIMMCFSKQDRSSFQSIYEMISSVLIEPDKVDALIKCNDYENFIQMFISLI